MATVLPLAESIRCNILFLPEYMLPLEFFLTPQREMRDQECEQPHVPCGVEERVQDVKSELVWDLNQPRGDVVYELFEKLLLFLSYYKKQTHTINLFGYWNSVCCKSNDTDNEDITSMMFFTSMRKHS
jgi:hypothetical protein